MLPLVVMVLVSILQMMLQEEADFLRMMTVLGWDWYASRFRRSSGWCISSRWISWCRCCFCAAGAGWRRGGGGTTYGR